MLVLFLTLLFLALPPPNHSSSSPASAPSASANGGAPSSLATSSRVPRDTKQQPIKVLISDGCTQGDSEGRELELDPGSPLVLTHRIRLVSGGEGGGGGAGGCSSCDDMLAKLRERIERLEREVSDLREKCGGPEGGGCCASEQSKGPGCTVRPATCPDDCSDQGRCVDGRCVCFEGFSGDDCSQAACDPPCDRGKCVNGQCVCDAGFTGLTCSESACSPACVRGRCVNGKCVCDRGFTGPDCSEAACVPACVRGTCVNGQCVCDPGFTGPTCSDAECVPACVRGTCVNGQCVCDPGFTGPTCSDAECVPACDRGTCVNGQCVCDPGFTGPACSEAACDPACVRGRCVNGRCVCDAGFTGADCSEAACKPACKNRGKCVNGKCECAPGFTGSDCGTKGCPNNCSNKGRCVRGKCVCRKGFTGPDCTDCEPGRSGPDCTVGLTGVTGLTAKDITDSSATLVWNQPSVPYDNYDITLTSQKEGDKITSSVGGRLTTYTQTGLAAGQEYHVSITGEKDGQSGPESTTDFVTLISSITNLRLVKTSTTYAIIQWDLPTMEIDRYHLIVTPTSGGTAGQEISLSADVTSTQIDHLVAGVEYDVTLVAERDGIRSAPATIQVVPGPEPPTNLIFSDLTDTTVSVSWTKPRSPVTGFKVTYTHTQEGEPVSVTVGASESTVDLSGLTPGSSYEVNIISQLDLDESDPLKDMLHTLPDPPTGLQAINITDSKALLLWRPALAAVDNYVIVYGSANGPEVTVSVSGNAAAQQLEQLESTTEYSVTITSHLGNRKSSGATTTFTTTGGGGGLLPQDLTATQITPRSALLTWKPPAATVSGYKLQYAIEGQAFQDVFVSGELLEQRLLRLRPGSKYVVRLQAEIGGVYTEAITTEFTTGALRFPFPTDCSQELLNGMHESGLADIFPLGEDSTPISVYCDQETDGGGWTVLQRRMNGKVDFFKSWKEYVSGFGDRSEEFWLGNDLLHNLTKMTPMSLRVDMRAEGETVFAKYSSFSVGPAKFYTLKVSGYTGTAGDSMTYHNGRHFSTRDRDRSDIRFCAMSYRGGWWYRNCHEANLNGVYGTDRNHQGVIWTTWKGKEYSIPFVEMKMRPTSFRPPSQG
ncbi:tenascin isoform X2 [Engraulis encrasicolus]|uniref:tenascin isoform X2 n=1 Tax=Engraulis encrasicolus TaxID=184585 RepID=UPI002FD24693